MKDDGGSPSEEQDSVRQNNLDNQHRTTRKFERRWFRPYVVMSANDNAAYHLAELDGSRLVIPIAGKRVKIFKKRQEEGPDLNQLDDEDSRTEPANLSYGNKNLSP